MNKAEFDERNEKILKLLEKGKFPSEIAIKCDCSVAVVRNVKNGLTGVRIYDL